MRLRSGGTSSAPGPASGSLLLLAIAFCLTLAQVVATVQPTPSPPPSTASGRSSAPHSGSGSPPPRQPGYPDRSVIRRALWVLLGISGLGMLYFIIRSIRLKKTQRKKYGLLSSYDDHVEMAPMDTDDDDTTLFEVKGMRRSINHTASQSC